MIVKSLHEGMDLEFPIAEGDEFWFAVNPNPTKTSWITGLAYDSAPSVVSISLGISQDYGAEPFANIGTINSPNLPGSVVQAGTQPQGFLNIKVNTLTGGTNNRLRITG